MYLIEVKVVSFLADVNLRAAGNRARSLTHCSTGVDIEVVNFSFI